MVGFSQDEKIESNSIRYLKSGYILGAILKRGGGGNRIAELAASDRTGMNRPIVIARASDFRKKNSFWEKVDVCTKDPESIDIEFSSTTDEAQGQMKISKESGKESRTTSVS